MANIKKKAAALLETLKQNGMLQKTAEKIEHIASPENQGAEGRMQQKEIENGVPGGDYASAKNATPIPAMTEPDLIEGNSATPAKQVLSSTGTSVNQIATNGDTQGTPTEVYNKVASLKQKLNACVKAEMEKHAAYVEAQENQFVSATEVMTKVAALALEKDQTKADAIAADIELDFRKLAKANPLFGPACLQVAFRKMAAEIEALAASEGIPEEDAAAALDASMEADPAAQEEFNNEVEGEALSDLAGAEQETEAMMAGLDDTAAKVSEVIGQPVTGEDLLNAVDEVVAQAELLGVEPEALIQAAAEEMAQGADTSAEDEQMAQALVEEAANQGISPEELIQALSGALGAAPEDAGGECAECAPGEKCALCDDGGSSEDMDKSASYHTQTLTKLASTKRGANLAKILLAAANK